jgi:NAD(P)-dependent dehydrogenase (short-subunit alcohol dehydrogenase family)
MSESRLALITGGAQGLGRAIAGQLARAGCRVLIADIQPEVAQAAAASMNAAGHEAHPLALDVGDEAAVLRCYGEIEKRFARLDILVNNAGVSGERAPVESITLEGWETALRTNLTSQFLMSRGAVPLMRRHRWGRIVNMSSLSARSQPGTGRCAYVASKAGIIGLSRILADEVGRDGITVNCVAPSRIRTALTIATSGGRQDYWDRGAAGSVFGRLGEPDEIAHTVAWLCSDQASFVTGAVLDVNGGTVMR